MMLLGMLACVLVLSIYASFMPHLPKYIVRLMDFKFIIFVSAVVFWAIVSGTFEEKFTGGKGKRFLAYMVCVLIVLISLLTIVHLFAFVFVWFA
ncbi:MAG: hypothetical protein MJ215_03650 [Spirochaetia bacterium]|nr:hypothetical protein [Spirochaetia bacterium]